MDERTAIWHQMLSIFTSQVFSIGLINGTLQPVLHSNKLQKPARNGVSMVLIPHAFWVFICPIHSGLRRSKFRDAPLYTLAHCRRHPNSADHIRARFRNH